MSKIEKYLSEESRESRDLADILTRFFLGNAKTSLKDLSTYHNKESKAHAGDFSKMLEEVMSREDSWATIHNKLWTNMLKGFSKTIESTVDLGWKELKKQGRR